MNKKEIIILFLIMIISWILTYKILKFFEVSEDIKPVIIEKTTYLKEEDIISNLTEEEKEIYNKYKKINEAIEKITLNKQDIEKKENKNILNKWINKKNYYILWFRDKEYLISWTKKSYNYWFITKEMKDNILYIYSHNSYKFSENSWYYIYRNVEIGDEITFNKTEKYEVINIIDFNLLEKDKNLSLKKETEIVYFTCDKDDINKRRILELKPK